MRCAIAKTHTRCAGREALGSCCDRTAPVGTSPTPVRTHHTAVSHVHVAPIRLRPTCGAPAATPSPRSLRPCRPRAPEPTPRRRRPRPPAHAHRAHARDERRWQQQREPSAALPVQTADADDVVGAHPRPRLAAADHGGRSRSRRRARRPCSRRQARRAETETAAARTAAAPATAARTAAGPSAKPTAPPLGKPTRRQAPSS